MITHSILIEPVSLGDRGYRYCVTYNGKVLLESVREPLLEACRALAAKGLRGRLQMWRTGKAYPDMVADIERGARLTVAETAGSGPVLRAWQPFQPSQHGHAFAAVTGRLGQAF